ncbi:hypothetical protein VVNSV5830_00581 [Vibrio vulnificus]|nr:hypothetical protein VVORL1506_01280 [Vibrio vulnificus]OJI29303.1 hypothetical protein VVNSV5830_00581 [Vibrio vulnificus]
MSPKKLVTESASIKTTLKVHYLAKQDISLTFQDIQSFFDMHHIREPFTLVSCLIDIGDTPVHLLNAREKVLKSEKPSW